MKYKALFAVSAALALPAGVAVATSTGGEGQPSCKPSYTQKCHHPRPPVTTTVTTPGTTTTVTSPPVTTTVTAPGTTTTVTTPAPPTPAPTVVVTPGSSSTTVNVTVTVNGVPTTVTVPGTVPGTEPTCTNTRKSAILGPLPARFKTGMRVGITSNGHTQFQRVRTGHRVLVNLSNLTCGVYPMVIRHAGLKPALRIWSLTGGNTLRRFWFPGIPGVSGVGLN